ncbi:hypothetical protein ACSBR1_026387 [Camellia fascicularis]
MSQGWVCAKQGIEVGGWSVMALEPHHLRLSLRSPWATLPRRKTSMMSALWMVIIFLSLLPHRMCFKPQHRLPKRASGGRWGQ